MIKYIKQEDISTMFRVNDKVKVIGTNKKGIVISYDEVEEEVYEVEVKIEDKIEKHLSFDLKRDGPLKLSVDDLRKSSVTVLITLFWFLLVKILKMMKRTRCYSILNVKKNILLLWMI